MPAEIAVTIPVGLPCVLPMADAVQAVSPVVVRPESPVGRQGPGALPKPEPVQAAQAAGAAGAPRP